MKILKITVLAAFGLALGYESPLLAQGKDGFGVGVIVGEPTGLSLKKWVSEDQALDAGIAWSFSNNDSLHLHADYLWHRFNLLLEPETKGQLPVYYGVGARVKARDHHDDTLVGVRIPFGISYLFEDVPVDLFAEIVPILDVAPDTDLDLNAAIGARYYF